MPGPGSGHFGSASCWRCAGALLGVSPCAAAHRGCRPADTEEFCSPLDDLMAPPGTCDILMVYLIEEFAGRKFLSLHE